MVVVLPEHCRHRGPSACGMWHREMHVATNNACVRTYVCMYVCVHVRYIAVSTRTLTPPTTGPSELSNVYASCP